MPSTSAGVPPGAVPVGDTPRETCVRERTSVYSGGMENEPRERTARDAREHFADMINDAIQGHVTYVTSNSRRVAAVVPLAIVTKAAEVSDDPR